MRTRKYEIQRGGGNLTIRTVKSGGTGWSVNGWVLGSILIAAAQCLQLLGPSVIIICCGFLFAAILLSVYESIFSGSKIVLDAANDQVIGFRAKHRLSDMISVTVSRRNPLLKAMGVRSLSLFLNTVDGDRWTIASQMVIGADVDDLTDAADEINAFLAKYAAAQRANRPAIWSWG